MTGAVVVDARIGELTTVAVTAQAGLDATVFEAHVRSGGMRVNRAVLADLGAERSALRAALRTALGSGRVSDVPVDREAA